jgi:hypothetical protein
VTVQLDTWTFRPERLVNFANYVFDQIVATFDAAGVPLPDRRLMTVGLPVHDCEQLVFVFVAAEKGMPGANEGNQVQRCDSPTTASFNVHLARCFPVATGRGIKPPTAAELTANALMMMQDCWLLMAAAESIDSDPRNAPFGIIASVGVSEPQGGFAESILTLQTGVP